MGIIESYIARLESLKIDAALASVEKPLGKEAFDYGLAVGQYRGIELAISVLKEIIEEQNNGETKRFSAFGRPLIGG